LEKQDLQTKDTDRNWQMFN